MTACARCASDDLFVAHVRPRRFACCSKPAVQQGKRVAAAHERASKQAQAQARSVQACPHATLTPAAAAPPSRQRALRSLRRAGTRRRPHLSYATDAAASACGWLLRWHRAGASQRRPCVHGRGRRLFLDHQCPAAPCSDEHARAAAQAACRTCGAASFWCTPCMSGACWAGAQASSSLWRQQGAAGGHAGARQD